MKLHALIVSKAVWWICFFLCFFKDELDDIVYAYDRTYHTDIEKDVKANFSPDVTKLILRILHKDSPDRPFEEGEEEEGEVENAAEAEAD